MKTIPKGEILKAFRTLSSGTVAHIIGSSKYIVIDMAISKAMEYVMKPENTFTGDLDMELIANILLVVK